MPKREPIPYIDFLNPSDNEGGINYSKKCEEIYQFPFPTWSELREIIKEGGVELVFRDTMEFLFRLVGEMKIDKDKILETLKPLLKASLEYNLSAGFGKRLSSYAVLHTIAERFPIFVKLDLFKEENVRVEIERGFNNWLGKQPENFLDLRPTCWLELIPKIFPKKSQNILDFFIEKLPILEEKTNIYDLRIKYDELIENQELKQEDFKKNEIRLFRAEQFMLDYINIDRFIKEFGTQTQIEIFEEKYSHFRSIQSNVIDDLIEYYNEIEKEEEERNIIRCEECKSILTPEDTKCPKCSKSRYVSF